MKSFTSAFCACVLLIGLGLTSPGGAAELSDARIKSFIEEKKRLVETYGTNSSAPAMRNVPAFFEAAVSGQWADATNRYGVLWESQNGAHKDAVALPSDIWGTTHEAGGLCEILASSKLKFIQLFGDELLKTLPDGAIYFGGTAWGRFVVAGFSKSHTEGKPVFTITQNALADKRYLNYVRSIYGKKISVPDTEEYDKVIRDFGGSGTNGGMVSAMNFNGELARLIFTSNPKRQFSVEESFPVEWMYPYLTPDGPILKLQHKLVSELSPEQIKSDRRYWTGICDKLVGHIALETNSVENFCETVTTVYSKDHRAEFKGDRDYLDDADARQAFSKLRCAIAGVFFWHIKEASSAANRKVMEDEAEFAFRQAWLLCPTFTEASFRYMNLLLTQNRREDAIALINSAQKLDPDNAQISDVVRRLKY